MHSYCSQNALLCQEMLQQQRFKLPSSIHSSGAEPIPSHHAAIAAKDLSTYWRGRVNLDSVVFERMCDAPPPRSVRSAAEPAPAISRVVRPAHLAATSAVAPHMTQQERRQSFLTCVEQGSGFTSAADRDAFAMDCATQAGFPATLGSSTLMAQQSCVAACRAAGAGPTCEAACRAAALHTRVDDAMSSAPVALAARF